MTEVAPVYEVVLSRDAECDLEGIYKNAGRNKAEELFHGLLEQAHSLSQFPERGSYPEEMLRLGIKEFRQVIFKTWHLIYRVTDSQVIVLMVVDGRRNMESILTRRLLRT